MIKTGELCKINGNFGFIKQDEPGAPDMFCIPQACQAFGREMPPLGTKVRYTIVNDAKTGRPRADNVTPADGGMMQQNNQWNMGGMMPQRPAEPHIGADAFQAGGNVDMSAIAAVNAAAAEYSGGASSEYRKTGMIAQVRDNFGFIKQDSGEGDMFVLPPVPPQGTRVTYEITVDPKTGRPRAENVLPMDGGGGGGCGAPPPAPPPQQQYQQQGQHQYQQQYQQQPQQQYQQQQMQQQYQQYQQPQQQGGGAYGGGCGGCGGGGGAYGGGAYGGIPPSQAPSYGQANHMGGKGFSREQPY